VEVRDIEIFLTLAEELHFGRTAQRLHVSPARISKAVKQQERRIGAALFERTSRTVRLTPIGLQLRDELRPVYDGLMASVQRAQQAARGITDVVTVATLASNNHELAPLWNAFRQQHREWGLAFRYAGFADPFGRLRRGEIDVLITWLPVEEPDITVGPVLFTEPQVLVVPAGHPLAGRGPVSLEVLGELGVLSGPPVPEAWEDGFLPFYTPSGRPIERRQSISTMDDIFLHVGGGGVHTLALQATRFHVRPDVEYVPFQEPTCVRWAMVWRTEAETDAIRALARTARDLGTLVT
jgi:DNA-binding transcriptional LysR family regulator